MRSQIAAVLNHPKVWDDRVGGAGEKVEARLYKEHAKALVAGLDGGLNIDPFMLGPKRPDLHGQSGEPAVDDKEAYIRNRGAKNSTGSIFSAGLPGLFMQQSQGMLARADQADEAGEKQAASTDDKLSKKHKWRQECDLLRRQLSQGNDDDGDGGEEDADESGTDAVPSLAYSQLTMKQCKNLLADYGVTDLADGTLVADVKRNKKVDLQSRTMWAVQQRNPVPLEALPNAAGGVSGGVAGDPMQDAGMEQFSDGKIEVRHLLYRSEDANRVKRGGGANDESKQITDIRDQALQLHKKLTLLEPVGPERDVSARIDAKMSEAHARMRASPASSQGQGQIPPAPSGDAKQIEALEAELARMEGLVSRLSATLQTYGLVGAVHLPPVSPKELGFVDLSSWSGEREYDGGVNEKEEKEDSPVGSPFDVVKLQLPIVWSGFTGSIQDCLPAEQMMVVGRLRSFCYETGYGIVEVSCTDLGHGGGGLFQLGISADDIKQHAVVGSLPCHWFGTSPSCDAPLAAERRSAHYARKLKMLHAIDVKPGGTLTLSIFDGLDVADGLHGINWPAKTLAWATDRALEFTEGGSVVLENTAVKRWQSGLVCGQIAATRVVLAESGAAATLNPMGAQDKRANIQATNILLRQQVRSAVGKLVDAADLRECTIHELVTALKMVDPRHETDLSQIELANDGAARDSLLTKLRAVVSIPAAGAGMLSLELKDLTTLGLQALLYNNGVAFDPAADRPALELHHAELCKTTEQFQQAMDGPGNRTRSQSAPKTRKLPPGELAELLAGINTDHYTSASELQVFWRFLRFIHGIKETAAGKSNRYIVSLGGFVGRLAQIAAGQAGDAAHHMIINTQDLPDNGFHWWACTARYTAPAGQMAPAEVAPSSGPPSAPWSLINDDEEKEEEEEEEEEEQGRWGRVLSYTAATGILVVQWRKLGSRPSVHCQIHCASWPDGAG